MSNSTSTTAETTKGEETPVALTRDVSVKNAYSAAATALREKYRDEFNADVAARVKADGFEWSPRLTPAERAQQKIDALIAENPELAEVYAKKA